ncbi:WAGO-2 protein [Aphelenchoides avenae]|nr:WAGO-2 protein [Aphelenchus avenae]
MWALSQQRKTIYVYDVEFRGIRALQGDQGEQVVRFTKRNDDAMIILDRRDKVRAIFGGLVRKHHAFFAGPVFCDLQCTVFTTTDLPLERLTEDEKTTKGRAARKFDDLTLDEVHPRELFSSDFVRFEASFKRLRGRRELELGNLERYATNANPLHVDRTLIQFLELATSHYIFMESQAYATYGSGQSYLMAPIEHGFTPTDILMSDDGDNLLDPSNTAYLAIGMHKSVRLIAGPANGGLCALTVETKQSAFHVPGPLLEKVASAAAPATVESITTNFHLLWSLNLKYRGTRVVIASNSAVNPLGGRKCLEFMQFVTATSHTHFFLFEGRRISLYDHLRTQYAYVVSRPNAPLVQVKERRRTVHYPIELLEVADAQRIRMSQADPMLVRNTTRACALEPRKLFSHTLKNLEALNPDNPDLVALGLDVRGPIEIVGSIHTPPMIQYANKQVSVHRGQLAGPVGS